MSIYLAKNIIKRNICKIYQYKKGRGFLVPFARFLACKVVKE